MITLISVCPQREKLLRDYDVLNTGAYSLLLFLKNQEWKSCAWTGLHIYLANVCVQDQDKQPSEIQQQQQL